MGELLRVDCGDHARQLGHGRRIDQLPHHVQIVNVTQKGAVGVTAGARHLHCRPTGERDQLARLRFRPGNVEHAIVMPKRAAPVSRLIRPMRLVHCTARSC